MQCSSVPATYHLIQLTDPSQPTKLMILGPACSVANEVMGEVAERYLNITQVSMHIISSKLYRIMGNLHERKHSRFEKRKLISEKLFVNDRSLNLFSRKN